MSCVLKRSSRHSARSFRPSLEKRPHQLRHDRRDAVGSMVVTSAKSSASAACWSRCRRGA